MADSNEDDHFKTSDHTNHKPSPDQVPHLFFFFNLQYFPFNVVTKSEVRIFQFSLSADIKEFEITIFASMHTNRMLPSNAAVG